MTKRENLLALLRRKSHEEVPVDFSLCPDLVNDFKSRISATQEYQDYFGMPWRNVDDIKMPHSQEEFMPYYAKGLKAGAEIDVWGVAHEPGSEAARHMTYMRNPLRGVANLEEIQGYPFPDFSKGDASHQKGQVERLHAQGLAATGQMQMTIWETSWYIRGMEDLMADMMDEDPIAEYILDEVTRQAVTRARSYANSGVDIIFLGDDIGMQHSIMMSEELYRTWILPRLKKVVAAIREISPDILIFYHSCGYITPFIPHLIEAGIDVLNPLQSECMNFEEIYSLYGGALSFHGTIGTQQLMPFGSPEDVKQEVRKNLNIAKKQGGLFVAPTHLLEPEVPFENILAYVEACQGYPL